MKRRDDTVLEGDDARAHLSTLRALLPLLRPGSLYPEPGPLSTFFALLDRELEGGLRRTLMLHSRSRLPSLNELSRLRADQSLAAELIAQFPKTKRAPFLRSLMDVVLPSPSSLSTRLVHKEGGRARFSVTRDFYDVHDGTFVRFSFQLSQTRGKHLLVDRGDLSRASDAFSDALIRATGGDAEHALLSLSELPGLTVDEVVKGGLGPLEQGQGGPLSEVLSARPGAALHATLSRAGTSVTHDASQDPFATGAPSVAPSRKEKLGYRVSLERKLSVTPGLEAPLRAFLSSRQTPLLVRSR